MKPLILGIVLFVGATSGFGQGTGDVVGSVTDVSGARITGATVKLTNTAINVARTAVTNATGSYGFSSLQPGDYELSAEQPGFKKSIRRATVNVGRDVTVDFAMEVGDAAQAVEVVASASAINLVSSQVDSIVERSNITDLPLNGRSAYEMAKLVPGARTTTVSNRNADNQITIVGRSPGDTRYSVDGINVTEVKGGGGIAMNFSNEVVQEFQVSINNNDPSVGISSGGAINLVTRSGSNDLHGAFFAFFRNSEYAAFPGLSRPAPKPNPNNDPNIAAFNDSQTDPNMWRRQLGGILSGPILKDRLFWLASVEVSKQVAAATFDTNSADLAAFNRIASYPRRRKVENYRLDWHPSEKHTFSARFAYDSLYTRTSGNASLPATWSSFDVYRDNRAYVAGASWTAIWTPTLVQETRFGFTRWNLVRKSVDESAQEAQLYAPLLPRLGSTTVSGTNMIFGNEQAAGQVALAIQPQFISNFTYMHGKHTLKFGGSFTPVRYREFQNADSPFRATLFSPTQARQAGISIPTAFNTIGDVMQLPLSAVFLPVGKNPVYPFNGDGLDILWEPQFYAFVGDNYKATQRLTVNAALGWSYDAMAVPDRDLGRPTSIARFFPGGVGHPDVPLGRVSPSIGFAWDPQGGGKTVIRGAFGIYYATGGADTALKERSLLAPLGDGYVSISGTAITNPKTGTGVLNFASASANAAAGVFRLSDWVNYAPGIRSQFEQTIFTGNNKNFSVTNFDFFKANASNAAIVDPAFASTYNIQSMIGAQRQIGDWLLDATVLYNVTNHKTFTTDVNQLNRPASLGGPVMGSGSGFGQIFVQKNEGKANYRAFLFSARKRMSRHFQVGAAYTLSSSKTTPATLIDFGNYRNNYAFDVANPKHLLNFNVTVSAPWGIQLALVSQFQSKLPFSPFVNGLDLNGDGTSSDALPGIALNSLNITSSADDLRKAVADFNQNFAGKRDALGTLIQPINLPANFGTGDVLFTQDMRVSKKIKITERASVDLIGEVFNLFNIANLAYAASAGNLYSTGFGVPGSRAGNLFGSDGPRAFQFAARVSF